MIQADKCRSITTEGRKIEFYSVEGRNWSKGWKTNWGWALTTFKHAKKLGATEAFVKEVWDDRIGLWHFNIKSPELFQAVLSQDAIVELGACWQHVSTEGRRDLPSGNVIEKTLIYLAKYAYPFQGTEISNHVFRGVRTGNDPTMCIARRRP